RLFDAMFRPAMRRLMNTLRGQQGPDDADGEVHGFGGMTWTPMLCLGAIGEVQALSDDALIDAYRRTSRYAGRIGQRLDNTTDAAYEFARADDTGISDAFGLTGACQLWKSAQMLREQTDETRAALT